MESYNRAELVKNIYDSGLSLFTTSTLRTILGIDKENSFLVVVQSLVRSGVLERLEKGKYRLVSGDVDDFELAYFLYSPSYISLETALNLSGILSQFPYEITSVTPRKSREKRVGDKIFLYLHIKPSLFWGYQKKSNFLIAEPEKALLDSIYFASKGLRGLDLAELDWGGVDKVKLLDYSNRFPQTKQFKGYFKLVGQKLR